MGMILKKFAFEMVMALHATVGARDVFLLGHGRHVIRVVFVVTFQIGHKTIPPPLRRTELSSVTECVTRSTQLCFEFELTLFGIVSRNAALGTNASWAAEV